MKVIILPLLVAATAAVAATPPKKAVKPLDAAQPCAGGVAGLPCTTGVYLYDAAGNIVSVGADTFAYDGVSRLTNVNLINEGVEQGYSYDAYGNLTMMGTTAIPVDTATNRLSKNVPSIPLDVSYDGAGNVTKLSGVTYAYDASNMAQSASGTDVDARYLYDADDERVGSITPQYTPGGNASATRYYAVWRVRDTGQRVIREFIEDATSGTPNWTWTHDYLYRGALLLSEAQPDGKGGETMWHYHLDHLGTPRLVTSDAGVQISSHNFYPFGEEITDPNHETFQFTGHERDDAAGGTQYYMRARYDNVAWGRFLSVDPVLGRQREPQSWNRYAYALNNPLRYTDPDGRWVTNCAANDKQCNADAAAFEAALNNDLKSKDTAVAAAAQAYGAKGDASVVVGFGTTGNDAGTTTPVLQGKADGTMGMTATVMLKSGLSGTDLNAAVAHEGQHILDAQGFVATFTKNAAFWDISKNLTAFRTEMNAYRITNAVFAGAKQPYSTGCNGCTLGGSAPRTPADVDLAIKKILADPHGAYKLTPQNQGPRQFPEWTTPPPQP